MQNIIGEPLDQTVVSQLVQRSQRLSQAGIRAGTDIRYLGQKNAWVRLSSSVSIENAGASEITKNVNGEINIPAGTALSEQWVLKSELKNGNESKYGVSVGTGAYGTGGIGEIGYRPMPGIVSVSIESQPPTGAVRTATIRLKALNLNQLSILDVLYFRLGFSMLLEWGHSIFVGNDGKLVNGAIPIDISAATSKEYIAKQLAQKRIAYSHNYDGMLGIVTNYDWTQAGDGSYDCTLRLSGVGSVVESLKINTQDATPTSTSNNAVASNTTQVPAPNPTTPGGFLATGGSSVGGITPTSNPSTNTPADPNTTSPATDPAANAAVQDSALGAFLTRIQNSWAADLQKSNYFPDLFATGLDLLNKPTEDFKFGYSRDYMAGKKNVPGADIQGRVVPL